MKIEQRPTAAIKPYERNPRRNDAAVEAVARSIQEFGFRQPIVIDEAGVIIIGHTRLKAAMALGLAEVPVHVAEGLASEKAKAYRLADNRVAEIAEWDYDLLPAELTELREMDVDLDLLGFSSEELEKILGGGVSGNPGLTDPDAVPEPPDAPVTQRGDIWILGEHRLLCGDSTDAEDVARVMAGEKAMVMATDPPYGVAYDNAERPNPGVAKPRVANDELTDGPAMQAFLERMLQAALPWMCDHAAFYFWHPMLTQGTYVAAAAAAGILIHRQIIWVKPGLLLGRGDYHWRHELCFYGWRKGSRPPFYGPRNQDTIWEVASVSQKERKEMNHATPKPTALWDKPIENHTKAGEVIYEPFLGSGTTLIAAEKLGRKCYGIEISSAYCDVIVKRWEEYTGGKAVRQ